MQFADLSVIGPDSSSKLYRRFKWIELPSYKARFVCSKSIGCDGSLGDVRARMTDAKEQLRRSLFILNPTMQNILALCQKKFNEPGLVIFTHLRSVSKKRTGGKKIALCAYVCSCAFWWQFSSSWICSDVYSKPCENIMIVLICGLQGLWRVSDNKTSLEKWCRTVFATDA